MSRIALVFSVTAVLAVTAGLALAAKRPWPPRHGPKTFSITGHVDDLTPGVRSSLAVKIRNPWSRKIRVISISARVDPSGRPCPVGNVRILGFRGSLVIRPRASRSVILAASLRRSAPPACAGATFPLRFSGRAVTR